MRFIEPGSDRAVSADEELSQQERSEIQELSDPWKIAEDNSRELQVDRLKSAPTAKRGSGIYFGQLTAVASFWLGTGFLPWVTGQPMIDLGGSYPGITATAALPFSIYFALVANPRVPIVRRAYGIEYTNRDGGKLLAFCNAPGFRPITEAERQKLQLDNHEAYLRRQERLERNRLKRRELRAVRRLERQKRASNLKLRELFDPSRRR